jgi:O-antigen ligase
LKAFLMGIAVMVVVMLVSPTVIAEGRLTVTNSYDSNDIALLFACSFPLVLAVFLNGSAVWKILSAVFMVFLLLAILKTGSRGGLLAFLCGVVLIFFSKTLHLGFLKKLLFIVFIGLFLVSSQAENITERWKLVFSGQDYNLNADRGSGGRLALWKDGLRLTLKKHMIIGVGVGNSETAMGKEYGSRRWKAVHNSYIQSALELGIAGLIFYLALIRLVLNNYRTVIKHFMEIPGSEELLRLVVCLRISFISYLVAACFLSQFYSVVLPFFIAVSAGLKNYTISLNNKI